MLKDGGPLVSPVFTWTSEHELEMGVLDLKGPIPDTPVFDTRWIMKSREPDAKSCGCLSSDGIDDFLNVDWVSEANELDVRLQED